MRSPLTFTGGIPAFVAVEEMIPEAHEKGEPKLGPVPLVFGFALLALISVLLRSVIAVAAPVFWCLYSSCRSRSRT